MGQDVFRGPEHFTFDTHTFALALRGQGDVHGTEGTQQVAVAQGLAQPGGQIKLNHSGGGTFLQSFHGQPRTVGHGGKTTGYKQCIGHCFIGLQFKYRRLVHAADDADLHTHRPDVHNVCGLHQLIGGAVAFEQQVIQVEVSHQPACTAQFDGAEAARSRRAARAHQNRNNRCQA